MAADGGSVIRMRKKNANWAQNMAKRIPYAVLKERVERSKPPLKSVVVNGTFGDINGDGDINGRVGRVKVRAVASDHCCSCILAHMILQHIGIYAYTIQHIRRYDAAYWYAY